MPLIRAATTIARPWTSGPTKLARASSSGDVPSCVRGSAPVELLRFYVDQAWHGQGIAQVLMAEVIAAAVADGSKTLWLGVWERNPRALAFYGKCGFRDVGSHEFVMGTDHQTDRILARSLERDGAP